MRRFVPSAALAPLLVLFLTGCALLGGGDGGDEGTSTTAGTGADGGTGSSTTTVSDGGPGVGDDQGRGRHPLAA